MGIKWDFLENSFLPTYCLVWILMLWRGETLKKKNAIFPTYRKMPEMAQNWSPGKYSPSLEKNQSPPSIKFLPREGASLCLLH